MASAVENHCTVLISKRAEEFSRPEELQARLENEDASEKAEALKEIILLTMHGQPQPRLRMSVIKYCINTRDHFLKKLLLVYWEVVEKTGSDGKLLPEMILVCNAIRNDLQHPNEYIRGITLRFLCKIKHQEILESLVPVIIDCLSHRHSYVRKNAVLTMFEIFKNFPHLLPDAPERVEEFLHEEPNAAAKRNAFLMLFHCDQQRAIRYLVTVIDQISTQSDSFQMVFLELARKVCRATPKLKPYYLRAIFNLLNSNSNTVAYEAANSILTLSSAPTAVRSALATLCQLLSIESDNNVKLIILNRITELRERHEKYLQEMIMDILRVLSSPNIDIRRNVLETCLKLVSLRNIEDVVKFLKKEIVRSEISDELASGEYKKILVQAIYECAVKFPHVASNVVHLLMNFIGDANSSSALDVVYFIREILHEYANLRGEILSRLFQTFAEGKTARVFSALLWIFGEFAEDSKSIQKAMETILSSIGDLPLVKAMMQQPQSKLQDVSGEVSLKQEFVSKTVILADGTYAQQTAVESSDHVPIPGEPDDIVSLRSVLLEGNFFLAVAVSNTLTKLSLRFSILTDITAEQVNAFIGRSIFVMVSMLRLGEAQHMDMESSARIHTCIQALMKPDAMRDVFLSGSKSAFDKMLTARKLKSKNISSPDEFKIIAHADDLLQFRQLKDRGDPSDLDFEDDDMDLIKAVGVSSEENDFSSRLGRIHQLTGFSDPIYAEACVTVHEFDIVLDILLLNQTNDTLQNVSLELSTSGDLKLVERPQGYSIAAKSFRSIQTNIKVSSTDSGIIFGNIAYDQKGSSSSNFVVLNSVHMDIVDYISPATCDEAEFRQMWAEFEWENKVVVKTDILTLSAYMDHLIKITNMKCLTSAQALGDGSGFLAANLYTKSLFGEDALLNVCIEKGKDGGINGHIRIRSKTQGIALSLGEKITAKQRKLE